MWNMRNYFSVQQLRNNSAMNKDSWNNEFEVPVKHTKIKLAIAKGYANRSIENNHVKALMYIKVQENLCMQCRVCHRASSDQAINARALLSFPFHFSFFPVTRAGLHYHMLMVTGHYPKSIFYKFLFGSKFGNVIKPHRNIEM